MAAVEIVLILVGVVFLLGSFFVTEKLSPSEISRVSELSEDELRIVMDRELGVASAKISDMTDQAVDLSMDKVYRSLEKDTNEKIMAISEYSDTVMDQLKKMNNEVTFLYSMLGDKHRELNESIATLDGLIREYQELLKRPAQPPQAPVRDAPVRNAAPVLRQRARVLPRPSNSRVVPESDGGRAASGDDQAMDSKAQGLREAVPVSHGGQAADAVPAQAGQAEQIGRVGIDAPAGDVDFAGEITGSDAYLPSAGGPDDAYGDDGGTGGYVREEILERYRSGEDLRSIARNLHLGYGEVKLTVELYKGVGGQ